MTTQAERIAIVLDVLKAHYPGKIGRWDVAEEIVSKLDSARPEPGEVVERELLRSWLNWSHTVQELAPEGLYERTRAALSAAYPPEALELARELLHYIEHDASGRTSIGEAKAEEKARALVRILSGEAK